MEELEIKQLILDVLDKGYLLSLATADEAGVWACDVIYVHDDELNIYWMSAPDTRHSQAVLSHPQAAAVITVSGQGEENLGIQVEGMVEKIEGERLDLMEKHFAKRKKPVPEASESFLRGRSWYCLKPKRVDVICERLFGFEKRTHEL
jgi:uncharacterized protein YhbP (UPF0306 family)